MVEAMLSLREAVCRCVINPDGLITEHITNKETTLLTA